MEEVITIKYWTTVDDPNIKVGDKLTINKHDLWRITHVGGTKDDTTFVDIDLIHR